jgi:hypothetical protein
MKKVKILNLEQFLQNRGLEYMVVIGPQWENEDAKGKQSEDRFYILDSALEQNHYVRSVWRKGEFSSAVQSALDEFDRHETKMSYSHDIDLVKKKIFAEGEKAYNAYIIKQKREHGDNLKSDKTSAKFKKLIKEYGN